VGWDHWSVGCGDTIHTDIPIHRFFDMIIVLIVGMSVDSVFSIVLEGIVKSYGSTSSWYLWVEEFSLLSFSGVAHKYHLWAYTSATEIQ
jgi:hypothetical protein